jgi:hypothetical protein
VLTAIAAIGARGNRNSAAKCEKINTLWLRSDLNTIRTACPNSNDAPKISSDLNDIAARQDFPFSITIKNIGEHKC